MLCLFLNIGGAWSQVPRDGGQQHNDAQAHQKAAAPVQPTLSATNAEEKPNNRTNEAPKKPSEYPWSELYAPANIPNWVLVIVAAMNGGVICWQSWELHEQTRHMINKERARIDVGFPNGALELDDGPEWTEAMKAVYAGVEITVSNLGATRAFNVAAKANIVGVPQIGSETSNEVSLLSLPSTIEPEAEPIKADVITLLSGIDHIAAVNDGSETLYLEGNVTYEDVFGKRHMTQFRYVWRVSDMPIGEQRVDTSQWEKTEKGNEAD